MKLHSRKNRDSVGNNMQLGHNISQEVKMPYRKYNPKKGKHGPIFRIASGIIVSRNSSGNWLLIVNKGGVRKNRTVGSGRESLIKAIKAAEALSSKVAKQVYIADEPVEKTEVPRFAEYSKDWLKGNSRRWRATTQERYECILRFHIWPNEWFSSKRLDKIKRTDVKRLLRHLFDGRSASTVETTQTVIHSIFEDAIDDQILSGNPARLILKKVLPAKRKRKLSEPMPLNRDEAELLIKHMSRMYNHQIQLVIKSMLYGGLRLGEALAMRVEYLDFSKKAYQVRESYKRENFTKPKNGLFRWVDLPEFLLDELRMYILSLKKQNLKLGKPGNVSLLFVDPAEKGLKPYSQRKIQVAMKRLSGKSEISARSPHDLRHTYASWLLMAHQSPAYVQKQLGHSSIDITVDIYGHWISGEGRDGLENALMPERNPDEKCIFLHIEKEKARN